MACIVKLEVDVTAARTNEGRVQPLDVVGGHDGDAAIDGAANAIQSIQQATAGSSWAEGEEEGQGRVK